MTNEEEDTRVQCQRIGAREPASNVWGQNDKDFVMKGAGNQQSERSACGDEQSTFAGELQNEPAVRRA